MSGTINKSTAVPPVFVLLLRRTLSAPRKTSFDDNGITVPDWGRSKLVFHRFLSEALPPHPV
jgi:hypothetical protein